METADETIEASRNTSELQESLIDIIDAVGEVLRELDQPILRDIEKCLSEEPYSWKSNPAGGVFIGEKPFVYYFNHNNIVPFSFDKIKTTTEKHIAAVRGAVITTLTTKKYQDMTEEQIYDLIHTMCRTKDI